MVLSVRPLNWDERAWLHAAAIANFAELAPDLPTPGPTHYDHYWSEDGHEPIALLDRGDLVGFAMVRMRHGRVRELAEFYISPARRRKGLGREAARAVLCSKPGPWVLGVAKRGSAGSFWHAVLNDADWLHSLVCTEPFYPAQSHSYTFTTCKIEQDRPI